MSWFDRGVIIGRNYLAYEICSDTHYQFVRWLVALFGGDKPEIDYRRGIMEGLIYEGTGS